MLLKKDEMGYKQQQNCYDTYNDLSPIIVYLQKK